MMAAIGASDRGYSTVLLERNEKLGKKIYITGKGRGNFTNGADIADFFDRVSTNPKFLYSSLYQFDNRALIDFLEDMGLRWKEERGGRIFPASDHASDITKALNKALVKRNVDIRLNTRVRHLVIDPDDRVRGVVTGDKAVHRGDHVIIATGGRSYPSTGSTGDGFLIAEEAGIAVTETYPALVPLESSDEDVRSLQGLSLKNVSLKVMIEEKVFFEDFGEMLFTHFGLSGPLVLSASARVTSFLAKGKKCRAVIDLKPKRTFEQMDERLRDIIVSNGQKRALRLLEGVLPKSMNPVILKRSGIPLDQRIARITAKERQDIVRHIKGFAVRVTRTRGFKEAIITQGGINTRDIDPSTMRAKKVSGLSFAGEVIDVDALTGGYNMQIAFSTGYLAGISV